MIGFKSLTEVKHWVIVAKNGKIYHYETFQEALDHNQDGHMMTKEFYEYHYANSN